MINKVVSIFLDNPIIMYSASIILIGLIAYQLVHPEADDKRIIYGELVLSFIVSMLFLLACFVYILIIFAHQNPIMILFPLLGIAMSPFGLTIIRTILQAYQQDIIYDKYLSVLTIASIIFVLLDHMRNGRIVAGIVNFLSRR